LNGKGFCKTIDNVLYKGQFENGLKHGYGTENSKLCIYEGFYINNLKHGIGRILFNKLEEIYEGEFFEDKITGIGTLTWKNNDKYVGQFIDKKMHGFGTYYWTDGSQYEGEYCDNIKIGKGIFKWNNGNVYEGLFLKGVPHGIGTILVKGLKYECEFSEGKLIKKGNLISNIVINSDNLIN